jgi:hypothetical protein
MAVGGSRAFGCAALERHVDAVLVQFALAFDIAKPLFDETIRQAAPFAPQAL